MHLVICMPPDDVNMKITDSIFMQNIANNKNGPILETNMGYIHVESSELKNNTGQNTVILSSSRSIVTLDENIFEYNVHVQAGNLFSLKSSNVTMTKCSFLKNRKIRPEIELFSSNFNNYFF